jgi:hypothetical protein
MERLNLSKPEEIKRFAIVDLWETHFNRSLTLGEVTLGEKRMCWTRTSEGRRARAHLSYLTTEDRCP